MDCLRADIRQYGRGKKLTLFPHSPPDPHGRSTYKVPNGLKEKRVLSEREEDMSMTALCFDNDNQPHLLDTSQHDDPANSLGVEIIENLADDIDGDNQVLLIFDPLFFPEDVPEEEGPWKVTSRADMKLSREAGAYKELHGYNLTGYPHLAPQYYGCWTTRLISYSPEFEGMTRHVGLVLIEYIQGTSIRDLCRHGADEVLIPPKGRICVHTDGPDSFNFTEDKRLDILALLLAGVVEQVYKGVWHEYVEPENVLVTMRNKSAILETPRVALIAYDICTIDSKCKKPMNRWERFPHTPHPSKCFDLAKLYGLGGWWPLKWEEKVEEGELSPFEAWLLERFGPLDSDKYSYKVVYRRQWLLREKQIKQELKRRAKRQEVGAKREATKENSEIKPSRD
ncbi:hypothetical protein CNYM01_03437 [Colletotrichum nymphaeae SA-01]|uniref:Protein kinase domain-containing protein n=1 Tax=Colletotrichum nymphaeae SA-01 TaxID=1460502 RepID=A0A135U3U0_9PEZI|nr:hypothetical protein CNYM01_03437 [Colletotrichum nymphaeae SA-01]